MIRRLLASRLRTIDAAALAATALLAYKIVEIGFGRSGAVDGSAAQVSVVQRDELPSFAQVLARARTDYAPARDGGTTGAVPSAGGPAEENGAKVGGPGVPATPESSAQRSILERLGERREALDRRDREIDSRERLIETAERKLEGRINELRSLEQNGPAARQRGEEEAALKSVVTMYEAMKPKDAARVFDRLPLDVLVPLAGKMSPRKMAEVLSVMQPESAERLTVALAQRGRAGEPPARPAPPARDLPAGELPGIDQPPPEPRKQP